MLQGPASKGPPGSTVIILGGFRVLDEEDFGSLFSHFSLGVDCWLFYCFCFLQQFTGIAQHSYCDTCVCYEPKFYST